MSDHTGEVGGAKYSKRGLHRRDVSDPSLPDRLPRKSWLGWLADWDLKGGWEYGVLPNLPCWSSKNARPVICFRFTIPFAMVAGGSLPIIGLIDQSGEDRPRRLWRCQRSGCCQIQYKSISDSNSDGTKIQLSKLSGYFQEEVPDYSSGNSQFCPKSFPGRQPISTMPPYF